MPLLDTDSHVSWCQFYPTIASKVQHIMFGYCLAFRKIVTMMLPSASQNQDITFPADGTTWSWWYTVWVLFGHWLQVPNWGFIHSHKSLNEPFWINFKQGQIIRRHGVLVSFYQKVGALEPSKLMPSSLPKSNKLAIWCSFAGRSSPYHRFSESYLMMLTW